MWPIEQSYLRGSSAQYTNGRYFGDSLVTVMLAFYDDPDQIMWLCGYNWRHYDIRIEDAWRQGLGIPSIFD